MPKVVLKKKHEQLWGGVHRSVNEGSLMPWESCARDLEEEARTKCWYGMLASRDS